MTPTPLEVLGKRRRRNGIASSSVQDPSPKQALVNSHKRRRKMSRASLLESLPDEILEMIFLESREISLPLASPLLHRKLNSEHTRLEFSLRIFRGRPRSEGYSASSVIKNRLVQCRFFTMDFYSTLRRVAERREWPLNFTSRRHIYPIMLPKKLLRDPSTPEKIELLNTLVQHSWMLNTDDVEVAEAARLGIMCAIRQNNYALVSLLLNERLVRPGKAIRPTTEMLRSAVLDHGCPAAIVLILITRANVIRECYIDLLDEDVWRWSEGPAAGDKGVWLRAVLRFHSKWSDIHHDLTRLETESFIWGSRELWNHLPSFADQDNLDDTDTMMDMIDSFSSIEHILDGETFVPFSFTINGGDGGGIFTAAA